MQQCTDGLLQCDGYSAPWQMFITALREEEAGKVSEDVSRVTIGLEDVTDQTTKTFYVVKCLTKHL